MSRSLVAMTTRLMDSGVRSTEAASRLGLRGRDVYALLFAGELDGGPGRDGMVYFDEASLEAYLERHGSGYVSNNLSNEPRRTGLDDAGRATVDNAADLHGHGSRGTHPDQRSPGSSGS